MKDGEGQYADDYFAKGPVIERTKRVGNMSITEKFAHPVTVTLKLDDHFFRQAMSDLQPKLEAMMKESIRRNIHHL